MVENYKQLEKIFTNLDSDTKKMALDELKNVISTTYVENPLEKCDVIVCPRCGDNHVSKKGFFAGSQRYLCKNCNRTFGSKTNTIFGTTKLNLGQWLKYAECFIDGLTLEDASKKVNVSLKTSFFMRKKILDCVKYNQAKFNKIGL